jgi:hypothetical protein
MKKTLSFVVVVGLVVPSVAHAETSDDVSGFELGFRTGLQLPAGTFGDDASLSDVVGSGLPLWFDIGHRVSRTFYYGFHIIYTPSLGVPDWCSGCSASNFRPGFGFQVHPSIQAVENLDPWFGFGVTYDSLSMKTPSIEGPFGQTIGGTSKTALGMEFANIQVGVDYLLMPELSAGVFFSYSFGMYFGYSDSNIHTMGLHDWISLGIRGAYRL